MNRIGQAIYEARTKAKLSPKALGKACGLTEAYILQVEAGKKIAPESVVEKIMKQLGEQFEHFDATAVADKEKAAAPQKPAIEKPLPQKPTETVMLSGLWEDALAGVIRKYPIMRGAKRIGERELVIANKKINGIHPDKIAFVSAQESVDAFRIHENDLLMLAVDEALQNDKLYAITYYGKFLIRKLRKESSGKLSVSPGLGGGSAEAVEDKQIKVLGRVLSVEFTPK